MGKRQRKLIQICHLVNELISGIGHIANTQFELPLKLNIKTEFISISFPKLEVFI